MTDIRITDDTVFERLERETRRTAGAWPVRRAAQRLPPWRRPCSPGAKSGAIDWSRPIRPETAVPGAGVSRGGGPIRTRHFGEKDSFPASDPPQQGPVGPRGRARRSACHRDRAGNQRPWRHYSAGPEVPRTGWKTNGPVALIDLADPDRYAAGHLPGAANLPLDGGFETAALGTLAGNRSAGGGLMEPTTGDDRPGRGGNTAGGGPGNREVLVYGGGYRGLAPRGPAPGSRRLSEPAAERAGKRKRREAGPGVFPAMPALRPPAAPRLTDRAALALDRLRLGPLGPMAPWSTPSSWGCGFCPARSGARRSRGAPCGAGRSRRGGLGRRARGARSPARSRTGAAG